jgi:hypothetical protein
MFYSIPLAFYTFNFLLNPNVTVKLHVFLQYYNIYLLVRQILLVNLQVITVVTTNSTGISNTNIHTGARTTGRSEYKTRGFILF